MRKITLTSPSTFGSRVRRTGLISGIAAGATATGAVIGRMSRDRQQTAKHQQATTRDHRRSINRWSEPVQHRLSFDTGDVSLMFDVCDRSNSQGFGTSAVSVAMMDFIAEQESDHRGHAMQALHRLLLTTHPHDSVINHASSEQRRTRTVGDDQLTAELQHLETEYLRYFHGITGRRYKVRNLVQRLSDVTSTLTSRDSQRRAAGARIILADLNLRQKHYDAADHEMRMALELIRAITPSPITDSTASQLSHATS